MSLLKPQLRRAYGYSEQFGRFAGGAVVLVHAAPVEPERWFIVLENETRVSLFGMVCAVAKERGLLRCSSCLKGWVFVKECG
jgi:hypothetical protein